MRLGLRLRSGLIQHEVVVLGGGPAGCAAATLLARRSHQVALVRRAETPAGALAESVPPSAIKLLTELGLHEAIDEAGFWVNRGNTVRWAGRDARVEAFEPAERGWHVDRASLEDVLVRAAEAVGVRVYDETVARDATERPETASTLGPEQRWLVRCEGRGGTPIELTAPWLVDATGRHGLLARREGRLADRATTTLALVRRWRRSGGWAEETAHHTLVESYEDGWAWSVPLDREVRCVTAMIDHRHSELSGDQVEAILDAEVAKTVELARSLAGAAPEGRGWACPASLYTSARFAREGLLLSGDAGSFIDPLSSYGVKKALSSGWLAGVVAHTALVDPAMTGEAVRFFDARERDVFRRYRAASVAFFEDAARAYDHPYWWDRARAARAVAGEGMTDADPDRVGAGEVAEARVRAAFESIKARASLDAVRGPTLSHARRAAVEGHRIVLGEHLASEAFPDGMRWVRGVDLVRLVDVAAVYPEVTDGWAAYNVVASPVTLPDYLTALSTAFAAGFLVHREG